MKFKTKKQEIVNLLNYAARITPSKTMQPIYQTVLLKNFNGELELISSDSLETIFNSNLQVDSEIDGSICVNAKKLLEIIKALPNNIDVSIEKTDTERLIIKSGDAVYTLYGYAYTDYPILPISDLQKEFTINKMDLQKIIDKTSYIYIHESEHFFFRGVYFENIDNKFTAVSTDGSRLSIYSEEMHNLSENYKLLIPTNLLKLVRDILKNDKDNLISANINVKYSDDKICFKFNNIKIVGSLLNGTYPDFNKVIPQSSNCKFIVKKELLLDCAKRVMLMSSDNVSKSIILDAYADKIIMQSTDATFGDAKEEIKIESIIFEQIKLALNGKYLVECINSIDSDKVVIQLLDSNSPVILKGVKVKNHMCILMPMRY